MNVLIVGGGKVGSHLATLLLAGGQHIKLIEQRREVMERLRSELRDDVLLYGSGTDPVLLETAGIRQVQVVAAVTGSDETNIVVATLARFAFGAPRVIARVNHAHNAWMFTPEMGIDVALNQADVMAHLIAEEMSLGDMITLLKLRKGQYALVEERVEANAPAHGRAIRDLHLPSECALTAIIRAGQLLIPQPDLVLQPHDEVLAVVHAGQAAQLAALLSRGQASDLPYLPNGDTR